MRGGDRMTRACLLLIVTGCAPRLYGPVDDDDDSGDGTTWKSPENTWPSQSPPDGTAGEGFARGQVVPDVRGTDQHGDEVSMWQFAGLVTAVDISTMWCAPCQDLAYGTEEVWQHYKDRPFMHLTVLQQNVEGADPTPEDLALWATLPSLNPDPSHPYDLITAPIVGDPQGRGGSAGAVINGQFPVVLIIGPDLEVLERIEPPIVEEQVVAAIERWVE